MNNSCGANSLYGIFFAASGNRNTLKDNDCTNNGDGIYLNFASNNTLIGNNCSANQRFGINLSGAKNNTIDGNTCTGNPQHGIHLGSASDNNTLTGNNCTGNLAFGLHLSLSEYNTLTGNNCTGNGVFGIHIDHANVNTLISNNCSQNSDSGIQITNSNATIIIGNTCAKNNIGITLDVDSYYNEVSWNWLKKNIANSIVNENLINTVHDNTFINHSFASFTANVTALIANQWANFTDTSIRGGLPLTHQWNFGDEPGNTTTPDVLRQYTSGGTWTAILTIRDSDGDLSVAQQGIQVEPDLVPAAIITPGGVSILLGNIADLHATPTGNSPANYTWDFGDETSPENGTHVTHLYTLLGTFTVTLNVTDADGDFATTTIQVEVTNPPPSIEHLNPISVFQGTTGNQIVWHASDPNVNNPTYAVTRNGQTILSGPWINNATVIVNLDGLAEGTYTFTLSINDGYGGTTMESVMVTVAPPTPWAIIIAIAGAGVIAVVVIIHKKKARRNHVLIQT